MLSTKIGYKNYKNSDGSLTISGKIKLCDIYSDENMIASDKKMIFERERAIEKSGIHHINDNEDTIQMGTIVNRLSCMNNEVIDQRRKYVAVTNNDVKVYRNVMKHGGSFGNGVLTTIYNYRMEILYDLKVASFNNVIQKILKDYGSKEIKDLYKEYKSLNLRDNYYKTVALNSEGSTDFQNKILNQMKIGKEDKWAGEYAFNIKNKLVKNINDILHHNNNVNTKICDYYESNGYDAIVDAEDYIGGFDYPVILLNPLNSVRLLSIRKIK